MEQYAYRFGAKIVAILEAIFAVIGVIALALLSGAAVYLAVQFVNDQEQLEAYRREHYAVILGLIWAAVVIVSVEVVLEGVAVIKLWKATAKGANPVTALPRAKFWRVVCIVFTVLGGIGYVLMGKFVELTILLIVRGIYLYFVSKYIGELENTSDNMEKGVVYRGNNDAPPDYEQV